MQSVRTRASVRTRVPMDASKAQIEFVLRRPISQGEFEFALGAI